jgi:hypothetical protein
VRTIKKGLFFCLQTLLADTAIRTSIAQANALFGEAVVQLSLQRNHFASCGFLACGAENFFCSVAMQKTTTKPFFNCRSRRVAKRLRSHRTDNMVWRSHHFAHLAPLSQKRKPAAAWLGKYLKHIVLCLIFLEFIVEKTPYFT